MTFSKIAKVFPAALLSDHTPFWKHDIPALFLTDTAFLRWDGYHTKSDEAKYLDYEILAKICKATIAMILRM
jgi:aminopeptidase-like protein